MLETCLVNRLHVIGGAHIKTLHAGLQGCAYYSSPKKNHQSSSPKKAGKTLRMSARKFEDNPIIHITGSEGGSVMIKAANGMISCIPDQAK